MLDTLKTLFSGRKETPPPPRGDGEEVGASGVQVFGGLLLEEDYNPDWVWPTCASLIDKMRKGDPTIRSGLWALKSPLQCATWSIIPGDKSAEAERAAEFMHEEMFGGRGVETGWDDTLRHMLLLLDFGYMPFFKSFAWDEDDGRVHLRRLSPRMPRTIEEIYLDSREDIIKVVQQLPSGERPPIKGRDLLWFVNEREGADWRGRSILRSAYMPWYFADKMRIVNAMLIERRGVGIDVIRVAEGVTGEKLRKAKSAAMQIRAAELGYFMERKDQLEYRIQGADGQIPDSLAPLQHHELLMLRALGVEFIGMGEGRLGSHGLFDGKTALYLQALTGYAKIVLDTVNCKLIPDWTRWNFGRDVAPPKLRHSRLDRRDVTAMSQAISVLVTGGVIDARDAREAAEELLGIAQQMHDDKDRGPVVPPGRTDDKDDDDQVVSPAVTAAARTHFAAPTRPPFELPREPEGPEVFVDFQAMAEGLDAAEDRIVEDAGDEVLRQAGQMIAKGKRVFDKGKIDDLEAIGFPDASKLATIVTRQLQGLVEVGGREVRKEAGRQGVALAINKPLDPDDAKDIDRLLSVRGAGLARELSAKVEAALLSRMVEQALTGQFDAEDLIAFIGSLSSRELRHRTKILTAEALSVGRRREQSKLEPQATSAFYSTMLDTSVCPVCKELQADRFVPGSADYKDAYPPLRSVKFGTCRGVENGNDCRCDMVLMFGEG